MRNQNRSKQRRRQESKTNSGLVRGRSRVVDQGRGTETAESQEMTPERAETQQPLCVQLGRSIPAVFRAASTSRKGRQLPLVSLPL